MCDNETDRPQWRGEFFGEMLLTVGAYNVKRP
jgi:hypothetical protein